MYTDLKKQLFETVEYLSEHIGPRAPGSQAELFAANWITEQFAQRGYQPVLEKFACPAHPAQTASLTGLSQCNINIIPTQHSPVGTVSGEFIWLGFGDYIPTDDSLAGKIGLMVVQGNIHKHHNLLDELEKKNLAGLIVTGDVASETQPNGKIVRSGRLEKMIVASVSINDARYLKKHISETVTLTIEGDTANDNGSQNIIATLAGKSDDTVVVIAHYDTAAGSYGAMDNAAGIALLLHLAEVFASCKFDKSIEFVASGAEEFGGEDHCGLGGKTYFHNRSDALDTIAACFEIDHIADNLSVRRLRMWGNDEFLAHVPQIEGFVRDVSEPTGGDGKAANVFGIPNVSMTDRFLSAPYYHTPADRMDLMDFNALVHAALASEQVLRSLCK